MFFVLKFELILIICSNNVLTEGARKVYRGRRVGQACSKVLAVSKDHSASVFNAEEYLKEVVKTFLRNVVKHLPDYTASNPRSQKP
jgi:hypothetical protein